MADKRKRRGNGEGTFRYREDKKLWMGQRSVNYKPITVYAKSKTDCREKLKLRVSEYLNSLNNPVEETFKNLTIEQWLKLWIERCRVKENTLVTYKNVIKHQINPNIGNIIMEQLTRSVLQHFIDEIAQKYSSEVVKKATFIVRSVILDALEEKVIVVDPMRRVVMPRVEFRKKAGYSCEILKGFLACAQRHRLYPLLLTIATTGLRRSEVLGLRWEDVNWDKPAIYVRNTRIKVDSKAIDSNETKNKSSNNMVPISTKLVQELTLWKQTLLNEGHQCKKQTQIFISPNGSPLYPDSINTLITRICQSNGLNHMTPHQFRHTMGNMMLEDGADLQTVQAVLRHADIATTANKYTQAPEQRKIDAVNNCINHLFQ